MTDPTQKAWGRSGGGRRPVIALAALVVMFALSMARVISAFEADALAIAALTGLLFWTQLRSHRQARRLDEKLDLLAIRLRYGPLTDDDLDTIRVLRSGVQARNGAAEGRAGASGWVSRLRRLRRLRRRPPRSGPTPPAA